MVNIYDKYIIDEMWYTHRRYYDLNEPYLYINKTQAEYVRNRNYGLSEDNSLYIGTFAFYKGAELWAVVNYSDNEQTVLTARYRETTNVPKFSDQLKAQVGCFAWDDGVTRACVKTDKTDLRSAMWQATRMKYFRKINNGLHWEIFNSKTVNRKSYQALVGIRKVEADKLKLKPDLTNYTIDSNFHYGSTDNSYIGDTTVPAINRLRNLTDTKAESQCSVINNDRIIDYTLYIIDLAAIKTIGYIDIQPGYCYLNPISTVGDTKYDTKFTLDIYYSDEDVPIEYVTTWQSKSQMVDLAMATGELKTLTSGDIGEYFKARYLKFVVNADEAAVERATEDGVDTYSAAIAGVAIYESDVLVGEAYRAADVINLYKDTAVYKELYTQAMVDNYADTMLTEFTKNQNKATAAVMWAPHLDVGMTIYVNDIVAGVTQNYFIEGISNNNGKLSLELAYYE